MKDLGTRVSAEVADAGGPVVNRGRNFSSPDLPFRKGLSLEMKILAVKAIEGASLIEDSEVPVAVFGALCHGIPGVPAAGAPRTDEIADAIRRQGVMIHGEVSLVRSPPFDSAIFRPAEATVTPTSLGNPAPMRAEGAGNPFGRAGRVGREAVSPSALIVNPLDVGPHDLEPIPDAIHAKADHIRDGVGFLSAMTASTHKHQSSDES